MSSEQCSLGSILPPNYRHRAEAFARDLQQRLWSLGGGRSSANEDRLGKLPLTHPAFEPCAPYAAFDEDSSPRSPTEDPVTDPLSQNLVNRSDGLPIPQSAETDSPRCSFSSDSQQSIYSTPSENFSLAACAKLARNEITRVDSAGELPEAPVDSCDLFLDLYSSAPLDHITNTSRTEDPRFNHEAPEAEAHQQVEHFESTFPISGVEPVNGVIEDCCRVTSDSGDDRVSSLETLFSKISLNEGISDGACRCENSSISRFDILENGSSSPVASVDRNANVGKAPSEPSSLDSSGIADSLNSSDAYSSDSLNESDTLNISDSLNDSNTLDGSDCSNSFDNRTIVNGHLERCAECNEQEDDEKTEPTEALNEESRPSDSDRVKLRRSSSLKTWKTPPDTPGRKKIVRFADVLGLDLADVRTFMDEIPQVPKSAFSDLEGIDADLYNYSPSSLESTSVPTPKFLVPLFQQPGGMADFFDKLNLRNVCLENASVTDPSLLAIAGTIRVRNIDYDKSVFVRYSIDGWRSFADLKALYVVNSCDGYSDQFSFVLYAHTLNLGDRLEFAVLFQTRSDQFWDNNGGINYIFQCVPPPSHVTSAMPGVGSPSISDKYGGFY